MMTLPLVKWLLIFIFWVPMVVIAAHENKCHEKMVSQWALIIAARAGVEGAEGRADVTACGQKEVEAIVAGHEAWPLTLPDLSAHAKICVWAQAREKNAEGFLKE